MTAAFNRRMRKTARTVVWEGWRAKSRHLDPIRISQEFTDFVGPVPSPSEFFNSLLGQKS